MMEIRAHHLSLVSGNLYAIDDVGQELWGFAFKLCRWAHGCEQPTIEWLVELLTFFKNNPETEFMVVSGLDSFCERCNLKGKYKSCVEEEPETSVCINGTTFNVGGKYRIKDLYEH